MSKARPALLLHLAVLLYYVFSLKKTQDLRETIDFDRMVFHLRKLERYQNITKEQAERYFDEGKYAGLLFFTVWNFALQIMFLILAVADEAAKLAKLTKIQRRCEAYRQFLFATLVLPSSLLVMTIFWVIWHIDRELIFPKAVDDFYPPWLNHTLHTAIAIPLIVEVAIQLNNKNNYYRISRMYAAMTIAIYCTIYQSLYLSVYIQHGIWLYPIYTVFTWAQRVAFVLMQFTLILIYQQVGISLLASREQPKIKGT